MNLFGHTRTSRHHNRYVISSTVTRIMSIGRALSELSITIFNNFPLVCSLYTFCFFLCLLLVFLLTVFWKLKLGNLKFIFYINSFNFIYWRWFLNKKKYKIHLNGGIKISSFWSFFKRFSFYSFWRVFWTHCHSIPLYPPSATRDEAWYNPQALLHTCSKSFPADCTSYSYQRSSWYLHRNVPCPCTRCWQVSSQWF